MWITHLAMCLSHTFRFALVGVRILSKIAGLHQFQGWPIKARQFALTLVTTGRLQYAIVVALYCDYCSAFDDHAMWRAHTVYVAIALDNAEVRVQLVIPLGLRRPFGVCCSE